MTLAPGSRLGPFEIVAPLGAGGMGEVWRGRDTRLDRAVAIKALPAAFAADPTRIARFEREAKLLASLNHPNIAGIHGLEQVDGHRYLVLELVDGETLADRLARGPIPPPEVFEICRDIAAGLEAAHEAGIVHRDLKPGNVMITPSGAVKILDFGLARGGAAGDASSAPNLSASPTLTVGGTAAGMILGTAAYMSPEQARGRSVDRRSDIWSFGCVLHECLTGRPVFEGDTVSDIIARILERDPDWSLLPEAIPPRVRALLGRCLTKDARLRLRDIGEARIALDEVLSGKPEPRGAGTTPGPQRGVAAPATARPGGIARVLPWVVALLAVIGAAGVTTLRKPPAPRRAVELGILLPRGYRLDAGPEYNPLALSRDGTSIAYTARHQGAGKLYYRRLGDRKVVELPGTEEARNPFFSPDGQWVAFFVGLELRKISVLGGQPVDLAAVSADRGGTWLENGDILYTPSFSSPLYRLPAAGGPPVALTSLDTTKAERTHRWPCALPGGEWVVFTVGYLNSPGGYDDADIDAVSIATGERRTIAKGSCARFAPDHRLIVARSGSLYGLPLDPRDPKGGGTPVPVLDGVLREPTSGAAFFDISSDGTLIHVAGRGGLEACRLAWATRDGRTTPVPGEPSQFAKFVVSPDGRRILAQIGPGGGSGNSLWLIDPVRGTQSRLIFGAPTETLDEASPQWMHDSRSVAWVRDTRGHGVSRIMVRSLDSSDSARVVYQGNSLLTLTDVAPDGRLIFFEYGQVASDVWSVRDDGAPPVRLVGGPLAQTGGVLSPDGKWIAYVSDESGRQELMVMSLSHAGLRYQVSTGGGSKGAWSPDGREIFFMSNEAVYGARVEPQGDGLSVDPPQHLFDLFSYSSDASLGDFDLDPTGSRFLIRLPPDDANERREIAVTLGWARP